MSLTWEIFVSEVTKIVQGPDYQRQVFSIVVAMKQETTPLQEFYAQYTSLIGEAGAMGKDFSDEKWATMFRDSLCPATVSCCGTAI